MKNNKTFLKFLKYSFQTHKIYYFIAIFNAMVSTGLSIFNIFSLKIILDALTSKNKEDALIYGGIIVLTNLVFNFLKNLLERLLEVNVMVMNEKIHLEVTTKLTRVPFSYLENPYYLDLKERAKFACENQSAILQLMELIETSIQSIITIIGLGSILTFFNGYILFILLAAIVLHTLFMFLSMKFKLSFYRELIPINRRFGYYLMTIQSPKLQKDYRLSNLGDLMANNFDRYADETKKFFWKITKKEMTLSSLSEIVNYLQMGLVYLFVAIKVFSEKLGAGTFTFYVSSAIRFSTSVTTLIERGGHFKSNIEYLKPLVELLELGEEKDEGKQIEFIDGINSIEFKNVSFSYPGSNIQVLEQINFQIEKGEKISIVGLNGAGKTTLIKLICRLYKPNEGEILINDINIQDYEYKTYMKKISAVFQDYKLFAFSIGENITLEENKNDMAIKFASEVGLKEKIDSLKNGIDSLYTKSFSEEGIELSGGESQKIAIARSLCKDASLVILDEPTSALDPLAEADIYQSFNSMVKDKTAIYISHRMSSSVFCDKILIIEKGKVIDYDSHNNLMKKQDSLYYQLFTTQAKNYQS